MKFIRLGNRMINVALVADAVKEDVPADAQQGEPILRLRFAGTTKPADHCDLELHGAEAAEMWRRLEALLNR